MKLPHSVYIDFEFNRVSEEFVNLVCAVTYDPLLKRTRKFWLHKNLKNQKLLVTYLKSFDTIIGYSCVAEARSFISLHCDPLEWKWFDLFLEYRLITNHNDRLLVGNQLVNGRVKYYKKALPKWERTDSDVSFKPSHSLAEATYRLTGKIRDTKHKTEMRDLIISDPGKFTREEAESILNYCAEDVIFLPEIRNKIEEEYLYLTQDEGPVEKRLEVYTDEALIRGRYAAHTAIMESRGYPIDLDAVRNFAAQVPNILFDMQREINNLFPDIKPFRWNKLAQKFSLNEKCLRDFIEKNHDVAKWMKTEKGKPSLALEAWQKFYPFVHDYPENNFGAQIVRFLKLKQSLYGFSESKTKGSFFDAVGSDGRVRPYLNIYGAQASRSQPGAKAFMFLKPAWMRALVQARPGYFIAGIDYGSQEFFVSALESGDENMIDAYLSGDPYFAFAKLAGLVPQDGVKADYKKERNLCKATVLGLSYMMSKYGLSTKLTSDTGVPWDEDDAQNQIDLFNDAFPDFREWQDNLVEDYGPGGSIRLPCGWRAWGDNSNHRSVGNIPSQGFGASAMRKAVDLAVEKGCKVIFTLHDAIYVEDKVENFHKVADLRDAMREGFAFYVDDKYKAEARKIKLDPFAWSPDFKKDSVKFIDGWQVDVSDLYVDERSINDFNKFKKYFDLPDSDLFK